jgi:hypothetical protein
MVGVDAFPKAIKQSLAQGIHDEYRQMSILDIEKVFTPNSFDVISAFSVIEHPRRVQAPQGENGAHTVAALSLLAHDLFPEPVCHPEPSRVGLSYPLCQGESFHLMFPSEIRLARAVSSKG